MSDDRPYRLLFVCTGNICRSPMAEAIARGAGTSRGRPLEVKSAGTMGIIDAPADPNAVAVCSELGLDVSGHRSQGVTDDLVAWADYILVMEFRHARWIRDRFGNAVEDKVLMLGTFGGVMEIADPLGGMKHRFRQNRDLVARAIETFLDRLPARDGSQA